MKSRIVKATKISDREYDSNMRAVFFDRDNTLTSDKGYCHKISDFAWMSGADSALVRLKKAAIPVFIITNQGGIAKGIFSQQDMQAFHNHLCEQALSIGGEITDIAFCPHHPDANTPQDRHCDCRKPKAGLFYALAEKWQINLSRSVMIGDRDSDVQAGNLAGCSSYLYEPHSNLDDLVKNIIARHFT